MKFVNDIGRAPSGDPASDMRLPTFERAVIATAFDLDYYRKQNPDLADAHIDLIMHYVASGWHEGRDPSPNFKTNFYISANPDVRACGINPFFHYICWGRAEGRLSKPTTEPVTTSHKDFELQEIDQQLFLDRIAIADAFDVVSYLENSPDLKHAPTDPILHYLVHGWREGRDPSPDFSTKYYLDTNPDIRQGGINPFVHYVKYGNTEGRRPRPMTQEQRSTEVESERITRRLAHERAIVESEFDVNYYLDRYVDLKGAAIDPILHYLTRGWHEERDPAPDFCTAYYLRENADIRDSGINPFLHYIVYGRKEGRNPVSFSARKGREKYRPLVSVIVPNYNHAQFLKQRLDSIVNQTYQNIELIILDDCSKDKSVEIIGAYAKSGTHKVQAILNDRNSGSVFAQWQRGFAAASGDLVWICESDDFCELNFLEQLVPVFADRSIMIGFGRVQFANARGEFVDGLDHYREQAEAGIWNETRVRTARDWFRGAFAVSNIIPNVGGCLIRRQPVPEGVWQRAARFSILGDWYIMLSGGGRLAYVPEAISYFRQHGSNTSVKGFLRPEYYAEHSEIIMLLKERWGVSHEVTLRFYVNLFKQYEGVNAKPHVGELSRLCDLELILEVRRKSKYVLIAFLGFYLGGGEIFPIHLANALLECGYNVSMLCLMTHDESSGARAMLDSRVPIYEAQLAEEHDFEQFVRAIGVDIIHSHNIGVEFLFFGKNKSVLDVPYVVTLHGSYEVAFIPDDVLLRVIKGVRHWIYLTKKNLNHLRGIPISSSHMSLIANGMPMDDRDFSRSREDLGIAEGDVVFTLVSRAIKEKGWRAAIEALVLAQVETDRRLCLLLCGSGSEADELKVRYENDKSIIFLGFQDRIHGLYRISDCAILPMRFRGESFPLALIQAMQTGTPVIATDVGEIRNMLVREERQAGVVIDVRRRHGVRSDFSFCNVGLC